MDINLDGGEILIIKALGMSSGLNGEQLIEKVGGLEVAELIDTLKGLIVMGYVDSDRNSFHSVEDLKRVEFRVNSGYAKELKEALDPQPQKKSRRVRRE
ncbi:MAG: hypothetical protein QM796_07055 [Chthoniobacteraceae bacterium]